jgi:hypothetical protein
MSYDGAADYAAAQADVLDVLNSSDMDGVFNRTKCGLWTVKRGAFNPATGSFAQGMLVPKEFNGPAVRDALLHKGGVYEWDGQLESLLVAAIDAFSTGAMTEAILKAEAESTVVKRKDIDAEFFQAATAGEKGCIHAIMKRTARGSDVTTYGTACGAGQGNRTVPVGEDVAALRIFAKNCCRSAACRKVLFDSEGNLNTDLIMGGSEASVPCYSVKTTQSVVSGDKQSKRTGSGTTGSFASRGAGEGESESKHHEREHQTRPSRPATATGASLPRHTTGATLRTGVPAPAPAPVSPAPARSSPAPAPGSSGGRAAPTGTSGVRVSGGASAGAGAGAGAGAAPSPRPPAPISTPSTPGSTPGAPSAKRGRTGSLSGASTPDMADVAVPRFTLIRHGSNMAHCVPVGDSVSTCRTAAKRAGATVCDVATTDRNSICKACAAAFHL